MDIDNIKASMKQRNPDSIRPQKTIPQNKVSGAVWTLIEMMVLYIFRDVQQQHLQYWPPNLITSADITLWQSLTLNNLEINVEHCQTLPRERENDGPRKLFPSWIVLCCVLWQLQCALCQLQSPSSFIPTWEEEHNTLQTSIHKHMTHATQKLGRYGGNHWSKLLPTKSHKKRHFKVERTWSPQPNRYESLWYNLGGLQTKPWSLWLHHMAYKISTTTTTTTTRAIPWQ